MIELTLAIGDYDHVRDLTQGEVRVAGCDLTALTLPPEEIFQRFAARREWEVSELSLALYASLRASGDDSLTAIPVFPSRLFRQGAIYVRAGTIGDPAQLGDRRVGIPEWAQTAGVWVRGMLADRHGVDLRSIEWVQGGVQGVGREERAPLFLPTGLEIRREAERPLEGLLLAGELDAIVCARPPRCLAAAGSPIVPLIADLPAAEREYYDQTRIHPIMHLVAIRRDVVERHPWLPQNLQLGFEAARSASIARIRDSAVSRLPLIWHSEAVEELEQIGAKDWFPYGLERNRHTLETFCRYAAEQGVTGRRLAVEELFHDPDPVTVAI